MPMAVVARLCGARRHAKCCIVACPRETIPSSLAPASLRRQALPCTAPHAAQSRWGSRNTNLGIGKTVVASYSLCATQLLLAPGKPMHQAQHWRAHDDELHPMLLLASLLPHRIGQRRGHSITLGVGEPRARTDDHALGCPFRQESRWAMGHAIVSVADEHTQRQSHAIAAMRGHGACHHLLMLC